MSKNELHLFVFEGSRSEPKYVEMLERNFLGTQIAVKCIFNAEIYQLYEQLKNDDFALDIINLLKERNTHNKELLQDYNRDSFAYIYLFFDYDAHATKADDDKISQMLDFFDNETENGLLYISYPMVEAIRHFNDIDRFKSLTVKCKRRNCPYQDECDETEACWHESHYKQVVAHECDPRLNNINQYTKEVWKILIRAHTSKMNFIVNNRFELPDDICPQSTIFACQLEKHINHRCPHVAVLSAFPLYVLDYFGAEGLKKKLNEQ